MEAATATGPTLEMAYVLFMDIVAYSMLPMDDQEKIQGELQESVRSCAEVSCALTKDDLICLPTGDGMALVFFDCPEAPAKCALELTKELRERPEIRLRMGIHCGPVYRVADINAARNVAGGGINLAQRVMDCGDAGHILISQAAADVIAQLGTWRKVVLQDLGEAEVKHGVQVHIYNLYTDDAGNPELPRKLQVARQAAADKARAKSKRLSGAVVAAIALAVAAGALYYRSRPAPFSKFAISQVTDTGIASVAAVSPDGKFIP